MRLLYNLGVLYLFMVTKEQSPKVDQGSISEEADKAVAALTIEQVEKWLTDDLGRARSLLQALHNDKNILRLVAVHLHGLAQNYNEAKKSLKVDE